MSVILLSSCSLGQSDTDRETTPDTGKVLASGSLIENQNGSISTGASMFDTLNNSIATEDKAIKTQELSPLDEWKSIYNAEHLWTPEIHQIQTDITEAMMTSPKMVTDLIAKRNAMMKEFKKTQSYLDHIKQNTPRIIELNQIINTEYQGQLTKDEIEYYVPTID